MDLDGHITLSLHPRNSSIKSLFNDRLDPVHDQISSHRGPERTLLTQASGHHQGGMLSGPMITLIAGALDAGNGSILRQFIKVNNLQETVFSFWDKYVIGENHHDYILL